MNEKNEKINQKIFKQTREETKNKSIWMEKICLI